MSGDNPACVKPPLGLRPKWVCEELRLREILEAVLRYRNNGLSVPVEWIDELAPLALSVLNHIPEPKTF